MGPYGTRAHMGPGPKWAQMGQGPNGPGPKWARAQMGPGPNGPGPKWARAQTEPGLHSQMALAIYMIGPQQGVKALCTGIDSQMALALAKASL